MDAVTPIHDEDGDNDGGQDEDLSDDSAADFPLFQADADDAEDRDSGVQAPLPTGGTALETAILAKLDDDKAQDIVLIDLKGKSPMADTMIVASGRSHRHVGALADHLLRTLKENGMGKAKVEGLPHCDWVLIDAGDLIVHIFRPEVREFYNIEKMWLADSPSEQRIHA